ncbi:NAD(P)H-hydrate dehydratase [Cerasicoccus arenae]|uniref:ADP-dependent (S)-NAD(P)H-hydrate dehydratase n=1 Tax=Cerasicoccus arenae TaxID=424488 RepID=A0A8J3DGU6_9BACT|nr:NAD(P)H-hydrate dehydratase [Cerasicoccus arenae]MBK1857246.1 NAD(P)H-hydrate dehydratase [Cerasicoccus arenae]GHC00249.1 bifunctional NAD(P)H-hydrate repair enzyme Nnr [Cerasicoccus arenae]
MLYAHPILTCEEALAWEKSLLAGKEAEWTAMNKAGRSLGRAALDDFCEIAHMHSHAHRKPRVLVLVGKGHNGGDALLAADEIAHLRPEAEIFILPLIDKKECRTLTRRAWDLLEQRDHTQTISILKIANLDFEFCLDGLLGMQFRPPLRENAQQLLSMVNQHRSIRFRVAVDLPSGLGDENAFRADFTYATGILKTPAIDPKQADRVGRLKYLDIGFFEELYLGPQASCEDVLTHEVLSALRDWRPAASDKRKFGHLFIVAGSRNMPGALLMNAMAAVRSGVGLVTAFAPESIAPQLAAQLPEVMWTPWPETPDGGLALEGWYLLREKLPRATALLCGSGFGHERESRTLIEEIVAEVSLPIVLDADALFPSVLDVVSERGSNKGPVIITPHAGEFMRLSGRDSAVYDREALTWFAHKHNVITVLKGPLTRVTDGKFVHASTFGGPVLARGGSGDLLGGLMGGLLAQWPDDAFRAAGAGVVWHGMAANLMARERGAVSVATTDLLQYLSPVLRLA